jgi:hypothetical protein
MYASKLIALIDYSLQSHLESAKDPKQALRHMDGKVPYGVHPVWSAITLLQEPEVPEDIRHDGAIALLFHDLKEDTDAPFPEDMPERSRRWAEEMTYEDTRQEAELVWDKPDEIKLLTLIEKTNTLLDGSWMTDHGRNFWCRLILRLADEVETAYGTLNIVLIARNVARFRKVRGFGKTEAER